MFSGLNGTLLTSFDGEYTGDFFGGSVSSAGDVDGDGFADLIVGARLSDLNGEISGMARVFSGQLPLLADTNVMSVSKASSQNLTLNAGAANAHNNYWLFTAFAASGNSPGVTMGPGVTIPLNSDALTEFAINLTQLGGGGPTFVGWKGILDEQGKASISLNSSGPVPVGIGITINHAALVYTLNVCGLNCNYFRLASNAVHMTTAP